MDVYDIIRDQRKAIEETRKKLINALNKDQTKANESKMRNTQSQDKSSRYHKFRKEGKVTKT